MNITCETQHTLPLSALTDFQGGLKKRSSDDVEKIITSIQRFGFATPFFVWAHDGINHVLDGHGRIQALKKMSDSGENIPDLPVVYINCETESEAKKLLLRINSTYGQMSTASVLEFMKDIDIDISEISLPDGVIDLSTIDKIEQEKTKSSLRDEFLVPPFSVLDTRQGYWQDRKRQWKSIGIRSDEGRDNKMLSHLRENAEKINGKKSTLTDQSIFDPVLCETMYTWFCMPGGKILDPFAGGSVRGIVASYKHMDYTGLDIRAEQIDANNRQLFICEGNEHMPRWVCCDSAKMHTVLRNNDMYDFIFSCPPYADLEKYSDIDGDISNMEYHRFLEAYRAIIKASCERLKNNRFAVFVVGEVRNKKTGQYYSFVPDTIKAFEDAGLKYYNEIILVNVAGGKAYTAGHDMKQSRKIPKVHQNILAFIKGDADEACKAHDNVLVFIKGDWKQTNNDLGNFICDNVDLPEIAE